MQVGSIGANVFGAYVYNTNMVNGNSLGKISKVPDDALNSGVEQEVTVPYDKSLISDEVNPLSKGETYNLDDLVGQQFTMV